MMKNDYRRSLIMLRTHAQGYSGHVRLERRTLMGSLYAVINVPNGEGVLCASLIRENPRGGYTAVKIGELRRDGRGQANLAWNFDPRNIDGFSLEDYWLIAIVNRDRLGRCSVVLSGNLNGTREVDWLTVQAAACAACREERPPVCETCPPGLPNRPAAPGEGPIVPPTPALPPQNQPAQPDEGPLGPPTPEVTPENQPAQPDEGPVEPPTPEVNPENQPARPNPGPAELPTPALPAQPSTFPESAVPADDLPEEPAQTVFVPILPTAAESLGLDASVPWPGVAEQVRSFFADQPAKELMLNDGYTYVSAPMPEGSGYDHVEVGLKLEQGIPVNIAYALPSHYTPEPPQGLENYVWKGGSADGWWTIETDVYTGAIV